MKKSYKVTLIIFIFCVLSIIAICYPNMKMKNNKTGNFDIINIAKAEDEDCLYLSDIDYIANQSSTQWGSILKDVSGANTKISVKVEGAYYSFDKGMWAHATSTLVYDISNVSNKYKYFTAYIGLNATAASSSNGVKYYIYTSSDGKTWDLKTPEEPTVMKAGMNAEYIKINIKGAKYLKLYANNNGNNGNDHSVYADAKFTNDENSGNVVLSVEEFDKKIQSYSTIDFNNKQYELLLYQRNFVNNVGQFALKRFISESDDNKIVFDWLFNNLENLREYTMGGAPEGGSYYNSLNVLSKLYKNYKSDLNNKESLNNKWDSSLTYGDLYKKMMISLSLTHSQLVGLWMQGSAAENKSDPVRRYAIYRYMHKNGNFIVTKNADGTPNIDITPWFETLHVEEMRFVLNNNIDDEEILWLNAYVQSRIDAAPGSAWGLLTPHSYIAYVWPNYQNPVYYDEANYDYFNELFAVPDKNSTDPNKKIGIFDTVYTIPGGVDTPEYKITITRGTNDYKLYKLWMNFRNKFGTGSVCGGISKSGSNIRATHGIPATVIGQPGHAALLYYTKNSEGQGYWGIDNDVSGWTYSEKGERMLLGWGNAAYSRGYSVVYMVLAQEAINDYENLVAAEKLVMLAKSYSNNLSKQEELYKKALEIQSINIDAWYGLIENYNKNGKKTEKDYYALAENLANKLMAFPLPMYHLTNLIKPKLTSPEYIYQFTLLQSKILKEASTLPNTATDIVLQPGISRVEANFLLGQVDSTIATFSFDGDDANKIVLSSRFDGNGVRWDYSLDGKKTWKEVSFTGEEEHKLELSLAELDKINAQNDIYVHIVGVDYSDENLYLIDIKDTNISSTLYANDLENRVIGINLTYEWRNSENDDWTSYAIASPNNSGNKTLYVRVGATGTNLPSESKTFTFTEDKQDITRKYISISHLAIEGYSTQSIDSKRPFYAPNAIDGNINTLWHTDFRENVLQSGNKPFITIKLDAPRYLSALEFVQTKYKTGNPDDIKNMIVLVSEDGTNWTEAGRLENCTETTELKNIEFDKAVYGQYVKLEMDTYSMFASLAMVNLFEDMTNVDITIPVAQIAYSQTDPTNKEVVARLINPSVPIKITNNNGSDSYTFTKNGKFTFEFETEDGKTGTALAQVDWIDTAAPTGTVIYSTTAKTNKEVTAILKYISEDIYILDANDKITEYIEVANRKVMHIVFYNPQGDISKIVYFDANDIAKKIEYFKNGEIIYVTELNPNGAITKETFYDENGNIIENPSNIEEYRKYNQMSRSNPLEVTFTENGTHIYKIQDKVGNKSTITAKVENIDITAPTATLVYDINKLTNKDVTATITLSENDAKVTNNGGKETYVFTKNGKFTFEFRDAAGNTGKITAKVDWIDKVAPTAELKYDKSSKTNAIVKVINSSEEITYKTGNGTYEFTKNGTYEIVIYDKVGNKATLKAVIDWLNNDKPTNPSKPDDNTGDNKPTKPSKPDDNTGNDKPTKPSKPDDNPGDNKPTKPSKPDDNTGNDKPTNPSKPDNNTGDNKPTNPSESDDNTGNNNSDDNPNTNQDNNNNNTDIPTNNPDNTTNNPKYHNYSIGNIIVEIPEDKIEENMVLKRNSIILNSSLTAKFGKNSEYFELSFQDELGEKITLNANLKMTIELDKTKEFLGIYEISDDNQIKTLGHKVNTDGTIEIETESLGKYVISYKESATKTPSNETKPETNKKQQSTNNNIVWFIASGLVVISGFGVLAVKNKKKY